MAPRSRTLLYINGLLSQSSLPFTHEPPSFTSLFKMPFHLVGTPDYLSYKAYGFATCRMVGSKAFFSTFSMTTDEPFVSVDSLRDDLQQPVGAAAYLPHVQIEKSEKILGDVNVTALKPKNSAEVFRNWGCTETDISKIFIRRPSLEKTDPGILQDKLNILSNLGISSNDLVKIVNCRPRFLNCRINQCLDERLEYLQALFGSKDMLKRAIIRNPSFLTYDLHDKIKPVIDMYYALGLTQKDLIPMLLSRPTIIPRSSLNDEKMDYIRRAEVSQGSKMYKYVVTIFAISRLETIREKVGNFEKFGFQEDEVLRLFGRSPLLLTLSVDKVQRNMTFILGIMKLPASAILDHQFLLFFNLESVLKPRFLLARKIEDMGLVPQIKGPAMLTALRMKEKRFVGAFIKIHPVNIANELMFYYTNAKRVKRLAESSKKNLHKGFPF